MYTLWASSTLAVWQALQLNVACWWGCDSWMLVVFFNRKRMQKTYVSWARVAQIRLVQKNVEKSLLVSNWEWLPKASWHPKAGCSLGILLFQKNSKWASTFWLSTGFWESLPLADQQTFFFLFYVSLTCASRAHDNKGNFHNFQVFFFIFDHGNTCPSMSSLVKIHNKCCIQSLAFIAVIETIISFLLIDSHVQHHFFLFVIKSKSKMQ